MCHAFSFNYTHASLTGWTCHEGHCVCHALGISDCTHLCWAEFALSVTCVMFLVLSGAILQYWRVSFQADCIRHWYVGVSLLLWCVKFARIGFSYIFPSWLLYSSIAMCVFGLWMDPWSLYLSSYFSLFLGNSCTVATTLGDSCYPNCPPGFY